MGAFVKVCNTADVSEGKAHRFVIDGTPVAVYHCKSGYRATHDTCTHAEASLAEGDFDCDDGTIECPLHGARFNIVTGKALSLPAVVALRVFPVEVRGEEVFVSI
jgi:3-phenylpropionate/trans-cinnamate dioxygenase ferredoxin subunit